MQFFLQSYKLKQMDITAKWFVQLRLLLLKISQIENRTQIITVLLI